MKTLEQLRRMLAEGRISRREFVARAAALGAAGALPGLLASESALAAPKRGGRLRCGAGVGASAYGERENHGERNDQYEYALHMVSPVGVCQLYFRLIHSSIAS